MDLLADFVRHIPFSILSSSNVCKQLSNLVCIHAWSWDLDSTCPVVVVVAESKSKLLNDFLGESRLIQVDKEMSWQHTTLGSLLRDEVEVKLRV